MGILSGSQFCVQPAKNIVTFFLLEKIRQRLLNVSFFLVADGLIVFLSIIFKVAFFAQSDIKVMSYLVTIFLLIISQASFSANDFKEVFPVQNHSAETALHLSLDEQRWLAQHKTVRIAYDGSLPPYSFVNDQGNIDGIAVEIMAILRQRLGVTFAIHPDYNWSSLYRAAAKRRVDMVATMVNRPDRGEWFRFTNPYLTKSLVIVTKQENASINSRNDLAGKKIAVVKGYQYGEQVGNEFSSATRIKADSMLESLKQVDNGQVDAAILFLGTANYLQAKNQLNHLKIAAFYDRNSANESIAVRKDWPELVGILQKGLDSLTEEEVQKIFSKWVVQGGVPSSSEATAQKIQPVIEPAVKPVIKIEKKPASFGIKIAELKPSKETLEIGKMIIACLLVLVFFLFWFSLIRKQKKLRLKAKNEMMTSARNLHSARNDVMHLTIEPPIEKNTKYPNPQPEIQPDFPAKTNIENLRTPQETLPASPVGETIRYQHDGGGQFNYVSPSVTRLLGYSEADFMANYRSYLTDNPINRHIDNYIESCLQGQPCETYHIEIYDAGQDIHWLEVTDSPIYDGQGHCIGVEGVMQDITSHRHFDKLSAKQSEQKEEVKASKAQSLPELIQQAIHSADTKHKFFALIYLSLERLRLLDGSLLSDFEADVLNEASKRLHATLRDTDSVVQLGIDKFALILPETDSQTVDLIVEKIRKILQVPYLIGIQSIVLDANMGVAVYPEHARDCESLINKAQILSPGVESTPTKNESVNDKELQEEDNLKLQQDLVLALDECKVSLRAKSPHNINALNRHSQFSVYYQSRHELKNYNIIGFEALIRWHHPELGLLLPKDFVELVKDIGLLDVMTYWIIQQVSFQALAWEKQGVRPGVMAVNLGDPAIKHAVEVNKILDITTEAGAKPEWLEFSIPESEIAKNPDMVMPIINQLVAAGFVVAIDNFGTDSSILSLLKEMPTQFVEIDPAFIRTVPNNSADAEVIKSSIALLHELGKTVIAKEVETERQLEFLKASGCDLIQGHLLSRPLPAKEAKELLKTLPDFTWYFKQ